MPALQYLSFDVSDNADGVTTLEAMVSTPADRPDQQAAVCAEADAVLGWAWRTFPDAHGPADDGMDWDHDLQLQVEAGGWHVLTLTLTGSPAFVEAFQATFGSPDED